MPPTSRSRAVDSPDRLPRGLPSPSPRPPRPFAPENLSEAPRTVSTHLTSIYNKLGVSTRLAAARFALDHRMA